MAHDPSNPFQHLAKMLAERNREDGHNGEHERRAGPYRARRARTGAAHRRSASSQDGYDEDRALFLQAVSTITPMNVEHGTQAKDRNGETPPPHTPGRARDLSPLNNMSSARITHNSTKALQPDSSGAQPPEQPQQPPSAYREAHQEQDSELFLSAYTEFGSQSDAHTAPNADEAAAFAKAMQGVRPVSGKGRAVAPSVGSERAQPEHDPAQALRDVLEGRVEFALHNTGEFMEGWVMGVDPEVLSRLRSGQYSPEAHLDLHGMNARQAYDALTWFIKNAYQRGFRNLVVVTGRGKNSPDGLGVLRPLLQQWLCRDPFKRVVLAFCTARPCDGGPGAVYVLLRKHKKSRGKIIWDHIPLDDDFQKG